MTFRERNEYRKKHAAFIDRVGGHWNYLVLYQHYHGTLTKREKWRVQSVFNLKTYDENILNQLIAIWELRKK